MPDIATSSTTPEPTPSRGVDGVLKTLTPYKELILLILVFAGVFFAARDYLATKRDVRLLECRQNAHVELMESEQKAKAIRAQVLALKNEIFDANARRAKTSNAASLRDINAAIEEKQLDLNSNNSDLDAENAKQRELHDRQKAGKCEDVVDGATTKSPAPESEGKK